MPPSGKKENRYEDIGITGNMAKWYDKSTRKSRLDEMRGYADLVSGRTHTGASILEIAPGPGYLSIELARRGLCVTGVEISPDFVKIENRNAMETGVDINFKHGNAFYLFGIQRARPKLLKIHPLVRYGGFALQNIL
jgi:2-polyprenyl-3-methyl-5-hydroxy-6-metoxy-1,4-benzoquinol methylase